jgi:hypothetical protein
MPKPSRAGADEGGKSYTGYVIDLYVAFVFEGAAEEPRFCCDATS